VLLQIWMHLLSQRRLRLALLLLLLWLLRVLLLLLGWCAHLDHPT
jgi:hypothetical protein